MQLMTEGEWIADDADEGAKGSRKNVVRARWGDEVRRKARNKRSTRRTEQHRKKCSELISVLVFMLQAQDILIERITTSIYVIVTRRKCVQRSHRRWIKKQSRQDE